MLFKNIASLLAKGVKLTIVAESADDGKIEVSLIPETVTGKTGLTLVAKSFVATPDEFDTDFANVIATYAAKNASLSDQVAAMDAQIAQVAKQAEDAAKSAATSTPAKRASGAKSGKHTTAAGGEMLDEDDDGNGDGQPTGTASASASGNGDEPVAFTL